ncbi:MAG: hypothetical protein R3D63_16840 [Paracoccaceae bacterium]
MYLAYQTHLQWRADALMAGQYEDLARHTATPIDVWLQDRCMRMNRRDDVLLQLHRLRVALTAKGVTRLTARVVAVELPQRTRRVWVHLDEILGDGATGDRADVIYHMQGAEGWMRTVGVEYRTLLVPELARPSFRERLARSRG